MVQPSRKSEKPVLNISGEYPGLITRIATRKAEMEAISLKLLETLLKNSTHCAEVLKMSRAAYVRRAIDNECLVQGPLCQLIAPLMSRVESAVREVLDMAEV